MSSNTPSPSPDWDMRPYFDEFDGATYRAFRETLADDVARKAGQAPERDDEHLCVFGELGLPALLLRFDLLDL